MAYLTGRQRALSIQFNDWPEGDKARWLAGTRSSGSLTARTYGGRLASASIIKFLEGYARWLGFLQHVGALDPQQSPGARLTYKRVGAYFRELQVRGNRPATIHGRMTELSFALKIIEPGLNFSWLLMPGGTSLEAILPKARKPKLLRDPEELLQWGMKKMDTAEALPGLRCPVAFRDGLLIAIEAIRAPRLRSIASLELGKSIVERDGVGWICFGDDDIRTKRRLQYPLPGWLTSYVRRYTFVERTRLLQGKSHDAFWVSINGDPQSAQAIKLRMRVLSGRAFDTAFGIHSNRHNLASSMPYAMPNNPGAGAAILGISAKMVQEHYNRSAAATAASQFQDFILEERRRTATLAASGFAEEPP
jgi:hypothetical protein